MTRQTDRPATTWAWTQVESPNLYFGRTILTFLALAELADRATLSPEGYSSTSFHEIADLTGQLPAEVLAHLDALVLAGFVQAQGKSLSLGWRIAEEAFAPTCPVHECAYCSEEAVFVVVLKTHFSHPDPVCGRHAASLVERNVLGRLTPIEAVVGAVKGGKAHV